MLLDCCTCAGVKSRGACLSALIDTSGGSDDGFQESATNAVVQAWVYYGLRQVAQLCLWIGMQTDADDLNMKADKMKAAFNAKFFLSINDKMDAVCDGICSDVNHTSVHSSFYALAFGLVDEAHLPAVFSYIMHRIDASEVGYPGGPYPIQFLLIALYMNENDKGHLALDVLTSTKKHGWLAMINEYNATTTMECWSPEELPNLSFSHIWSSSPNFVIPW